MEYSTLASEGRTHAVMLKRAILECSIQPRLKNMQLSNNPIPLTTVHAAELKPIINAPLFDQNISLIQSFAIHNLSTFHLH
eukprot:764967-Hanusia_phi.AAC.2